MIFREEIGKLIEDSIKDSELSYFKITKPLVWVNKYPKNEFQGDY